MRDRGLPEVIPGDNLDVAFGHALAPLGRDVDDPVCAVRAVVRGAGRSLQHLNGGDVIGIDVRNARPGLDPVNNDEGGATANRQVSRAAKTNRGLSAGSTVAK